MRHDEKHRWSDSDDLAYADPAIWLQPVAKLGKLAKGAEIWLQAAAKLTWGNGIEFLQRMVMVKQLSEVVRTVLSK